MIHRAPSEDGFSIIEALVAALIAGVAVTQFYGSLGTGIQLDAATGRHAQGTLTALSALDVIRDEMAKGVRIIPGQTLSGEIDGIGWQAQTRDASASLALDWVGALTSVHIAVEGQNDGPVLTAYLSGVRR